MFEQFRTNFELDDDKWSDYVQCFKRIEVPAKTILLSEGEVARNMFVIEKGSIRVWFNHNGKDISYQFFFELETVGSLESFYKQIPSLVYVETIEPCVLWKIHKVDLDRIIREIEEIPSIREKYIEKIVNRTFDYMHYFFSTIRETPQERYLNLIQERPDIVKRVPQHFIASYLGISTVHLSRIKSKLAREK